VFPILPSPPENNPGTLSCMYPMYSSNHPACLSSAWLPGLCCVPRSRLDNDGKGKGRPTFVLVFFSLIKVEMAAHGDPGTPMAFQIDKQLFDCTPRVNGSQARVGDWEFSVFLIKTLPCCPLILRLAVDFSLYSPQGCR